MTIRQGFSTIEGMRGDYSQNALSQDKAIAHGLEKAATQLVAPLARDIADANKLHIVDLGAADGVNSFSIVTRFAKEISNSVQEEGCDILVSHLDLPEADLNALVQNIWHHPASYHQQLQKAGRLRLSSAILPSSYYKSYLPPDTADIIFGTVSLHYASRIAAPVSGHVDPLYAQGQDRAAWQKQSVDDLDTIMRHAASALRSGGKFWAVAPAHTRGPKGRIGNHWYRELWLTIIDELADLQREGLLEMEAVENCIIPAHQRGLDEWRSWFAGNTDLFRLDYLEVVEQENPYLSRYRETHHDASRFADDYLASVRAWSEPLFKSLITDTDTRARFFSGLHDAFRQSPDRYAKDAVNVYVGATRI